MAGYYYSNAIAKRLISPVAGHLNNALNMQRINEDNYSITPEDVFIWRGSLPFKAGDTFPTPEIKARADMYKTHNYLYQNRIGDVYGNLLNLNALLQNPITGQQIINLVATMPDYYTITNIWTDMLCANQPKISFDASENSNIANAVISSSNILSVVPQIFRECIFMYGNSVIRIDRKSGANTRIINMPVKNWVPFVNDVDTGVIDVNMFFNIFDYQGSSYCEFILYYESGRIEKRTFSYNKYSSILGSELTSENSLFGTDSACCDTSESDLGVSPIVVFSGDCICGSIFGEPAYKYWDASIAASIDAFQTLARLSKKQQESLTILPATAIKKDDATGCSINVPCGTLMYDGLDGAQIVDKAGYKSPDVPIKDAIEYYRKTLERVSRDTALSLALFDADADRSVSGNARSGKALKSILWNTETRAKSYINAQSNTFRLLILKILKACGIDMALQDIAISFDPGVHDEESALLSVQQRNGGAVTLSVEDSIAILDGVPKDVAHNKARALQGLPPENIAEVSFDTSAGDDSVVSDVTPTNVALGESGDSVRVQGTDVGDADRTYIFGSDEVNPR